MEVKGTCFLWAAVLAGFVVIEGALSEYLTVDLPKEDECNDAGNQISGQQIVLGNLERLDIWGWGSLEQSSYKLIASSGALWGGHAG